MALHFFPKKTMPKEQMTPFKELSFGAKIKHIFYYYKYHMLAAVLIIITVLSFIYSYRANDYDTVCSFAIADGRMSGSTEDSDAITTGFTAYLGIDGKKQRVQCDYHYTLLANPLDQDGGVSIAKIYTLASTGSLDGFIANRDNIDFFSTDTELFLTDLREVLTTAELDKLADNIVYYTMEDATRIPIAVDLTHTKIKTETDFTIENPCYGIVVTAPNLENATEFIRYAFDL